MSTRIPSSGGRERPVNLAVQLRETFVVLNDLVLAKLAESGHTHVRPAHSAVFQYLDDTGTKVSHLAERAQMTKQAMAELVRHLETHDYVVRVQDPADGRAKLVRPTRRGHEVFAIAQALVPSVEARIAEIIGADRTAALSRDLEAIRRGIGEETGDPGRSE